VSPEIRANTALRICLRVTDPAESSDVIGTPEAALLERGTPGRGYLRSGRGLTMFQAAHPAGRTSTDPERVDVTPLGPWRRPVRTDTGVDGPTDLARLVTAISEAATRTGTAPAATIWQPPLPERLAVAELGGPPRRSIVRLARVDRPDQLTSEPLELDLTDGGSLLVAGTARSGRTQTLAGLALAAAAQLSPADLAIHVVDPGGPLSRLLAPLPHLATSLGPESTALAPRLLSLLARLERAGTDLLLVDGWDRLLSLLPDDDAATCGDLLAHLLRGGPAARPAVAVAGDRSVLMPRVSSGFGVRILLRQADRGDFGLAGIPARAVPATFVPGRGLRAGDGAVLQVALPPAPAEEVARRWAGVPPAPDRITLRSLPERVRSAELPQDPRRFVLGVGGDRCEPLMIDPFAGGGCMLVAGPPRSGRSTTLVTLLRQAVRTGRPPVVAAPPRSPLAAAAAELRLPVLRPDSPDPGPRPATGGLLLVDDCEAFADRPVGERLTGWLRGTDSPAAAAFAAVVAGRSDELAAAYRGVGAEVRRGQCGVLLRPGPLDGELLGVRLPRRPSAGPPGRGVIVGDPAWGSPFTDAEPVPVQVAAP
jgi:S-DNA-T family DNA segregation ATPase FtsK/SpoIIIE